MCIKLRLLIKCISHAKFYFVHITWNQFDFVWPGMSKILMSLPALTILMKTYLTTYNLFVYFVLTLRYKLYVIYITWLYNLIFTTYLYISFNLYVCIFKLYIHPIMILAKTLQLITYSITKFITAFYRTCCMHQMLNGGSECYTAKEPC